MKAEHQLETVKQWYNKTIALNRNWRESKREEERLREKQGVSAPRQKAPRQ